MKRLPFALVPWMVLATAANAQVRMADVLYTHFDDVPTRAFRVGDECFVGLDAVERWGWKATSAGDTVQVQAEGRDFRVPMRVFSGRQTLPLRLAVEKLGGLAEWTVGTDTMRVLGEVSDISFAKDRLSVSSTLELRPRLSTLTSPNRVVIDLNGVRLPAGAKTTLENGARVQQYRPDVARIIVQREALPDLARIPVEAGRSWSLDFALVTKPVVQAEPLTPPIQEVTPSLPDPNSLPLEVQFENESRVSIRLPLGEKLTGIPVVTLPEPTTLRIVLPGIFLDVSEGFRLSTEAVQACHSERLPDGTGTVLVLRMVRPMGAEVVTQGGTVLITILKPNVGGRTGTTGLRGKLVVVDPGHGGHDPGARSGGVQEKDLNLKISKLIAQALKDAGAEVVLTRETDVFIDLNERPAIANRLKADFFISTHINSTGKSATQSGTITFHHMKDEVSRVLAECIQSELAKVNKLPNKGVWSDRRLYKSGLAVLRQSKVLAVLLELGFINHPKDRARMVSDDFQRSVAAAVVRGIKVFLGDAKKND